MVVEYSLLQIIQESFNQYSFFWGGFKLFSLHKYRYGECGCTEDFFFFIQTSKFLKVEQKIELYPVTNTSVLYQMSNHGKSLPSYACFQSCKTTHPFWVITSPS